MAHVNPDRPVDVVVYGATGFTGALCARALAEAGLRIAVAGRSAEKLTALAADLGGCPTFVARLENPTELRAMLLQSRAVLACAGPFAGGGLRLVEAAIAAECTYLDISGEVAFYCEVTRLHEKAVAAGVTLVPAVGFDAVMGEVAASLAAQRLPAAVARVTLSLATTTQPSRGSLATLWAGLGSGGYDHTFADGELRPAPAGSEAWRERLPPPFGAVRVAGMGLVELLTVSRALACASVRTGVAMPQPWLFAAVARAIRWLHRPGRIRGALRRVIDALLHALPAGASSAAQSRVQSRMQAVAEDGGGTAVRVCAHAGDVGLWTAICAASCVQHVLRQPPAPGLRTPTEACGTAELAAALTARGARFAVDVEVGGP